MSIKMPDGIDQRVTIKQASEMYAVHPATVRRWIASGRLPAEKVGRIIRIRLADLDGMGRTIPSAKGSAHE